MPDESYRRWLRCLLLCLCDIFWVLLNSLVCWFPPPLKGIHKTWPLSPGLLGNERLFLLKDSQTVLQLHHMLVFLLQHHILLLVTFAFTLFPVGRRDKKVTRKEKERTESYKKRERKNWKLQEKKKKELKATKKEEKKELSGNFYICTVTVQLYTTVYAVYIYKSETRMTASFLKQDPNT